MSLQTSDGRGPYLLLWASSRSARGKIIASGIPNLLNYCVIYMMYTQFTNVALAFGYPWPPLYNIFRTDLLVRPYRFSRQSSENDYTSNVTCFCWVGHNK
jgi:hypothetical protein